MSWNKVCPPKTWASRLHHEVMNIGRSHSHSSTTTWVACAQFRHCEEQHGFMASVCFWPVPGWSLLASAWVKTGPSEKGNADWWFVPKRSKWCSYYQGGTTNSIVQWHLPTFGEIQSSQSLSATLLQATSRALRFLAFGLRSGQLSLQGSRLYGWCFSKDMVSLGDMIQHNPPVKARSEL